MQDPLWKRIFDEFTAMNGELSKAIIQNPLEYRSVAMAAVDLGSRPHDLDLDVEHAVAFCHRLMS